MSLFLYYCIYFCYYANNLLACSTVRAPVALGRATLYCSTLSVAFVGALYAVVPLHIRQLDRDDARQIRWRGAAAGLVCLGSILSFHRFFCERQSERQQQQLESSDEAKELLFGAFLRTLIATGSVLLHTVILYTGPLACIFVRVCDFLQRRNGSVAMSTVASVFYVSYIQPTISALWNPANDSERWVALRNLFLAPLTEEIVFRACMVPVLEATSSSTMGALQISLTAPLFFGFAHAHHAALKIRQGEELAPVLMGTAFQFAYTSIFGAYASYAYLRTRSLTAIVVCHAFCNAMGLPDLSFLSQRSPLYPYRWGLGSALVVGLAGFVVGLTRFDLPPNLV